MPRKPAERLASSTSDELKIGKKEVFKDVQTGSENNSVVNSTTEADRLFDLMNKELREKRKQAKAEGKSETEVKAIKFDKNSDNYRAWLEACSNNAYISWKQITEDLRAKAEQSNETEAIVQWEKADITFNKILKARSELTRLSSEQSELAEKTSDLPSVSGEISERDLKVYEKQHSLEAAAVVVEAQMDALVPLVVENTKKTADVLTFNQADFESDPAVYKSLVGEEYEKRNKLVKDLRLSLEKAIDAGEDVRVAGGLFDQWKEADKKLQEAVEVRELITDLEFKQEEIKKEVKKVEAIADEIPPAKPRLEVEERLHALAAAGELIGAETVAVTILAVGNDHGKLVEDFFESSNEAEGVEAEVKSLDAKGTGKIKPRFAAELSKSDAVSILFISKLNEYVGDDEKLADWLLNDSDFIEDSKDLFKASRGLFASEKKFNTASVMFLQILHEKCDQYRQEQFSKPSVVVDLNKEKPIEADEKAKADFHKARFGDWEKFGIETPKQLESRINTLNSDLEVQYSDLLANQDSLAQCSWYQLNKKGLLKDQIQNNYLEINSLKDSLVELGGVIKAFETKYDSKDFVDVNNALKALKAEKVGSKSLVDRYTELGVAILAASTFVFVAAESGREKKFKSENPAVVTTIDHNTDRMQYGITNVEAKNPILKTSEKLNVGDVDRIVQPNSVEENLPKDGRDLDSTVKISPHKHPTSKVDSGAKYRSSVKKESLPKTVEVFDSKLAEYREKISAMQEEYDNLPPSVDMQPESDEKIKLAKKLKNLKYDLSAFESGRAILTVEQAPKNTPPVQAETPLDFEGVKELNVLSEVAKPSDDFEGRVKKSYDRNLTQANNILSDILNKYQSGETDNVEKYITKANEALRMYSIVDVNAPESVLKKQENGREAAKLIIKKLLKSKKTGVLADFGGIGHDSLLDEINQKAIKEIGKRQKGE